MRASAILGLGSSERDLKPFQQSGAVTWTLGLPERSEDADAILVFGGDGTMHRHLAQLSKLRTAVLVVPRGSGNDFARALGLGSLRASISAWEQFLNRKNNIRTIDLGAISTSETQHCFCCIAGVGLDGEVARRANKLPRWLRGNGGYMISLPLALARFKPTTLRVEACMDGAWYVLNDQPLMLAAFANTPMFGGGMKIAPRAVLDDGKLDMCLVPKMNKLKLFCLFPTVYAGRHLRHHEVKFDRVERVRISSPDARPIYADGEYVCQTPAEMSVAARALPVIVPA